MFALGCSGVGAHENAELRRRHGQGSASSQAIVEAHPCAPEHRVISLVERLDIADLVDHPLLQVVLQIRADAAAIQNGLDAERREPFVPCQFPDKLKSLRRADRAGRKNDLARGADLERSDRRAEICTPQARPFSMINRSTTTLSSMPQIAARQRRLQKAARSRPAAVHASG